MVIFVPDTISAKIPRKTFSFLVNITVIIDAVKFRFPVKYYDIYIYDIST